MGTARRTGGRRNLTARHRLARSRTGLGRGSRALCGTARLRRNGSVPDPAGGGGRGRERGAIARFDPDWLSAASGRHGCLDHPDPRSCRGRTQYGPDTGRRRLSGRSPNRFCRRRGRWTVTLPAALQRSGQRFRRWWPVDPGRTDAGQQPVFDLPAPAAGPDRLLQPPPGAVVLFRWRFCWQCQPGAPRRRTHQRHYRGTAAGSDPAGSPAQPGSGTALAKPGAVSYRPHRQSSPQRNQHRKAVESRLARTWPTGTGGNSGHFACRRLRSDWRP
jgi:hypothetical protein